MSPLRGAYRRLGSPLAVQIVALLLGGLVVAQLTTLCLTLLAPPAPPPQYRLEDIAAVLKGGHADLARARPLMRTIKSQPPSLQSAGWLVSERSQRDLARMVGADEADVRLLFYSPPPFAGAGGMPPPRGGGFMPGPGAMPPLPPGAAPPEDPPEAPPHRADASFAPMLLMLFEMQGPGARGGMGGPGGGMGGGGFPGGGFPGGGGGFPSGGRTGMPAPGGSQSGPQTRPQTGSQTGPQTGPITRGGSSSAPTPGGDASSRQDTGAAPSPPISGGQGPMTTAGGAGAGSASAQTPVVRGDRQGENPSAPAGGASTNSRSIPPAQAERLPRTIPTGARVPVDPRGPIVVDDPSPADAPLPPPRPVSRPAAAPPSVRVTPPPSHETLAAPAPADPPVAGATIPRPANPAAALQDPQPGGWPIPDFGRQPRGLFGFAPPPFVMGDFVAAVRIAPNQWVTVQPTPEPFPNSWQRRVLLWFLVSFSIVGPVGYLFARRLASPLGEFAAVAERLGRDPSGPITNLKGPAEIGRAAEAFNQMQARLKRFIDDRTAMVGAISHDLRTPLARMRFRVERASPELRNAMLNDIGQMEEMISSVLVFIRDASEPSVRERVDLRSIVECVVDDAAMVGGDAVLDPGEPMAVDVDALGVQRVLANLVDNALKYGERAHVRMYADGDEAVAEIADAGPGLAENELEQVFLPFYRSGSARTMNKGGIGLGLAVSRSIARAHGGDVTLARRDEGMTAQLRLPLAYKAA